MKNVAVSVFVVLAVVSLCSGQWLERKVAVGDTIGFKLDGGIAVSPVSGKVYIEGSPTRVVDPASAAKIGSFDASGPLVFCSPSGKAYIIDNPVVILDAAGDTMIGTTTLPFTPCALAYSISSNRLYLASPNDADPLFVFDPSGDTMLGTVAIGSPVTALLWDSVRNRLYVGARSDSGLLRVVDCTADTVLAEVRVGISEVSLLALSSASNKLYCTGEPDTSGGSTVAVVSADSLLPVASVAGLPLLTKAAYSPVTDRLFCLDSQGDTLYVIDCAGDTVRSRVGAKFSSLAVSTISGDVYLGQRRVRPILVLDTSDIVVDSIPCPATTSNNVGAVTFNPVRNEVYAALTDDLAFMADAATGSVIGVFDYITYTPYQMVYNPNGSRLYLLCPSENAVLVMDSTFETTTFIYGGVTRSNAFPVLDSVRNRIYVAEGGVLRVIDCGSDSLANVLSTPGIDQAVSVLVPDVNKLFIFGNDGAGDSVYAYDCVGGGVQRVLYLSDGVPCVVFDPHSGLVYFACEDAPALRGLDPVTGSVVRELDLGYGSGSTEGRMAVNPDMGRLYLTDQDWDRMYTIDVDSTRVLGSTYLSWNVDTLVLNRRLGKLYLCSRDNPATLAFSCSQDTIVKTVYAGFHFSALMNDSNDKFYLRYGAVVDCRSDDVLPRLENINAHAMAWDRAHNRMFQAASYWLYVYRDDPPGVAEAQTETRGPMMTVLDNPARNSIRLRLQIPSDQTGTLAVHDAAGRLVHLSSGLRTQSYRLDLAEMPAGVYFVCLEVGRTRATDKVIVQR
jgi:DNA-binding beta-propeller fold protein YncE